ncbi:MAG: hypothetical protein ABIA75_00255 [Candidatus Neomarinimicrobiota bacterium]
MIKTQMKIRNNHRTADHIAGMIIVLATLLSGQNLTFNVSGNIGRADNIFNSPLAGEQTIFVGEATAAIIPTDDIRLIGTITRSEVLTDADLSTSALDLGLQYRNLDFSKWQLYAGLSLDASFYAPVYADYDSWQVGGYLTGKYFFKQQMVATAGYELENRYYPAVDQASNVVHNFSGTLNRSFKTGTSVNLQAWTAIQDFLPPPIDYQGRYAATIPEYEELPTNYLSGAGLRLTHSLHPRLGLVIQTAGQYRLNRAETDPTVPDPVVSPFVDIFRWDGWSGSARLNYRPGVYWQISAGISHEQRAYLELPIYEFDFAAGEYILIGDEYVISGYDRQDQKTYVDLVISREWNLPGLPIFGTTMTIEQGKNQSNDPLYDYSGNSLSLGLYLTH